MSFGALRFGMIDPKDRLTLLEVMQICTQVLNQMIDSFRFYLI